MTLSAGTKLGPYEILAPIGAGGMGEVYRAKDSRLGREVAIKVLPASFSQDASRLQRFEQEARAASALNHPNIVTVHDIGTSNGTSYMAMELVDGASLRQLLASGPLPEKKMLEVAVQIADGLGKAHSAGIVHRDLKPENVMVSKDGFVKLLDFGLAKAVASPQADSSALPTAIGKDTEPGTVLGTVGYMSPEQASGRPVDFHSDQFSLGSILYEMATGMRAFRKNTSAETLSAIIREEPEPVARINPRAPAPYRWIVERCLAKDPEERYASTRDLARDLKSVREHISEASGSGPSAAGPATRRRRVAPWVVAAALALGLAGGALLDRRLSRTEPPSFKQLTFRRGDIQSARFAPDGQTILYTAAWEGNPLEIFARRLESPESRSVGLGGAELLAVSAPGEMAISLGRRQVTAFHRTGRLAATSIAGGVAPREILEDVQCADFSPDGKELAVVREVGGRSRLEFPIGKILYETTGWLSDPRVSPTGDSVAFCHHPTVGDDGGEILVVDRLGKSQRVAGGYATLRGLAWSPTGREIWFTAAATGANRTLHGVTPSGRGRLLARVTGNMTLHDVRRDGQVLITHDTSRQGISGFGPGEARERQLAWHDYSSPRDLSADGTLLLFDESGEGGGPGYSVYIRKTDGSPATRLGDGSALALSPDGKWALALLNTSAGPQFVLYPTGVGEPKRLAVDGLWAQTGDWLPDGNAILITASEHGRGSRLYVRDLQGGKPRVVSPEGYRSIRYKGVSPDGRFVVAIGPDKRPYLYPIAGGEPQLIPGVDPQDRIECWTADGKGLLVHRRGEKPAKVYRLDVATGKKELWKELMPLETAGFVDIGGLVLARDGKSYVYRTFWTLSDLYLVEGIR